GWRQRYFRAPSGRPAARRLRCGRRSGRHGAAVQAEIGRAHVWTPLPPRSPLFPYTPLSRSADGGSGIFVPLPVGPLLGGFDAAGVLGATALQYKLIDNSAKTFDLDDDGEAGSGIENSLPTANPDSATVAQSVATDDQLMLVIYDTRATVHTRTR